MLQHVSVGNVSVGHRLRNTGFCYGQTCQLWQLQSVIFKIALWPSDIHVALASACQIICSPAPQSLLSPSMWETEMSLSLLKRDLGP